MHCGYGLSFGTVVTEQKSVKEVRIHIIRFVSRVLGTFELSLIAQVSKLDAESLQN